MEGGLSCCAGRILRKRTELECALLVKLALQKFRPFREFTFVFVAPRGFVWLKATHVCGWNPIRFGSTCS